MIPVLSSAAEVETTVMIFNCNEVTTILTTLDETGYSQPPTPVSTYGIVNYTIKKHPSKANIDMRLS